MSREVKFGPVGAGQQSPALLTQVAGAVACAMAQFSLGTVVGFPGVTLPQFVSTNNASSSQDIIFSDTQAALFSSIVNLGAAGGSLVAGPAMVCLGQRVALLLILPICLTTWLIMAFSNTAVLLIAARGVIGICCGFLDILPSNFVVELAYCKYRGSLSGIIDVARNLGMLFIFATGATSLSWRQLALVCGICTTVPPFFGLLFIPNSPRWLTSKGRYEEARSALRFYRGRHFNVDVELADIAKQAEESIGQKSSVLGQLRQLRNTSILKRFLYLCVIMFTGPFLGNSIVLSYAVPIFQETETGISPYMSTILIGVLRTLGAVTFLSTTDHLGRRGTFLISTTVCGLAMGGLGFYFFVKSEMVHSNLLTSLPWLPLASLLVYTFSVCIHVPVLCLIPGEILPLSFRSLGSSALNVVYYAASSVVIQTYPLLKESLNTYGTFWFYGGCSFLIAILPVLLLPETRKRSLEEIEESYKSKKNGSTSKNLI